MRILHVYKDFDPPVRGGIERHLALMCRYQREWAEVWALTCSRSTRTTWAERDGTQVLEVGEWGRWQSAPVSPGYPWRLRQEAARADVVVVHVPNPTAEVAWLGVRPRAKLVVRYHSDVVRQAAAMRVYGPIQMQFLRQADMVLPTSEAYLQTSATLTRVRERCRVVPLGIVTEDFGAPPGVGLDAIRARYGGRFVLFSGRHRYYKGLDYLVDAAAHIHAPVVIAGDGPERERIMARAADAGTAIHFPGQLSDAELVAHLHACDVFAFPSIERSEAFGISILEAHACGKPVVATRIGTGVEFANLDGETGLNVPPRDARALADAVNRLLGDEALRVRMGERAQARVHREFHAREIARREFDLYREAAGC
jgi:glycosyltransferase involved in cell wall biosynthesis